MAVEGSETATYWCDVISVFAVVIKLGTLLHRAQAGLQHSHDDVSCLWCGHYGSATHTQQYAKTEACPSSRAGPHSPVRGRS